MSETYAWIYTQEDDNLDMPSHVENHNLHLALGFTEGSVMTSVVGVPTNFSGVEGASEIGIGDRITGLMSLNGTTLGVFCASSIWSISGQSVDNFNTQVLSPNTGAIEYTLANCGQPVFLNQYGVSTLEQSAAYGDFIGVPLSADVASWLIPRCKQPYPGSVFVEGIACALPIRKKNQYRIFFNDGECLTMTFLTSGEKSVGFTRQQYRINSLIKIDEKLERLTPIAWTSEVDDAGRERVIVSHYNRVSFANDFGIYELDSGNSFNGEYIEHEFETNWYFGEAPTRFTGIQKLRMHGLSNGMANLEVYAAGIDNDYSFGKSQYSTTSEGINLPRTAGNIYADSQPVTNIANLSNRGLGIQLKFVGSGDTDTSDPEPGHVCQAIVVYSKPSGAPDV